MACKYADGTDIQVGDTVTYQTVDMESYSRGYGVSYETKTSRVRGVKVMMENGDMETPNKLTKVSARGGKSRKVRKSKKARARKHTRKH